MPVTEFECAIAKSQIGRYIAGENLGNEVVRQLETHIGACANCKKLLEEKRKSLMAMIDQPGDIKAAINTQSQAVATPVIATPAAAYETPAPVEAEPARDAAQDLKAMLREKLAAKPAKAPQPKTIDVPVITPAFAHKDEREIEKVTITREYSEEEEAKPAKKRFNFSFLALYRRVDNRETETDAPALSVKNLKAAKHAYRANNPTMGKPLMYAAGLAVVVAGMSFVLKDPTTMFGPTVEKNLLVKGQAKPTKKVNTKRTKEAGKAKATNSASRLVKTSGVNAQQFATETASETTPVASKPNAKKKASVKKSRPTPIVTPDKTLVTSTKEEARPKATTRKNAKAEGLTTPTKSKTTASKADRNRLDQPKTARPKVARTKTTQKTKPERDSAQPKGFKAKTSRRERPRTTTKPDTGTVRVYSADGALIK
jgi:hypothetical protein